MEDFISDSQYVVMSKS